MEAQFVLRFTPPDSFDYSFIIECVTERETFFVPIFAIGNRGISESNSYKSLAIIDLNDDILFGRCPVNFDSSKTILLRNIGDAPAKFDIEASQPFKISPPSGFLNPKESMQVELSLNPEKVGLINGDIHLTYETGEQVVSHVKALSHEVNIFLEKQEIKFLDQSIQKNLVEKINIVNHSDYMVHYDWNTFKSLADEDAYRDTLIAKLNQDFQAHVASNKNADVTLFQRKLTTDIIRVQNQVFLNENKAFAVEPVTGVVWPHASVEISVMFSPFKSGLAESMQYCSISGVEKKLELSLKVNSKF